MKNHAGLFPTDSEIGELINFLDGNNQGEVQLEELSMAMMQQVHLNQYRLRKTTLHTCF